MMKKLCFFAILFAPLLYCSASSQTLGVIDTNPLIHTLTVSEGQCVGVSGRIRRLDGFSLRAAILVVNFYDSAGKDVVNAQEFRTVHGYRFLISKWLKGHYLYLMGNDTAMPFCFDISVPKRAVSCKIRVGSLSGKDRILLKDFSIGEYPPIRALRHQFIALLLVGISLMTVLILRRKAMQLENHLCELDESCRVARRICMYCIGALCFVMASVFLWEAYSAVSRCKWGHFISFSSVTGQVLFVALLSVMLYYATNGRRWLIVLLLLLISLLLNVAVIRLTHSLYLQTMVVDSQAVETCINSPDVRCLHAPIFFYWCNYELLCSALGKLFGGNIQVAQYLNAFCAAAVTYPVFRLSEKAAGTGIAIFTSLLMGLSPVISVSGTILTGEILSAVAYTYALYFFIRTTEGGTFREKMWYSALSGLFMGGAQLLKPIAIIFILTFLAIALVSILHYGRKNLLIWLSTLTMVFGVFVYVGKYGQDVIIEVARPYRINTEGTLDRAFLIGLNVETHGKYDSELSHRLHKMTSEEQRRALKELFKEKWRRFPALFGEKIDIMYSDPFFAWTYYERSIAPSFMSDWVRDLMCAWNFLVLLLVGVGATGLVVARHSRKNDIGIAAVFVVAAFTAVLLLIEVNGRYKVVIFPIYFLLIPYVRVWVQKNRVYETVEKLWNWIALRIRRF